MLQGGVEHGRAPLVFPPPTMIGALAGYICHADPTNFQPMKANFGPFLPLDLPVCNKGARYAAYARWALDDLDEFVAGSGM